MKLFELFGVKKFTQMDHEEVIKYLEKELGSDKFKLLGKGMNGYAVLAGSTVYKFWMIDSAYTDFVKYALENQNNPFLPKFKSTIKQMSSFFIKTEHIPEKVNYIKMELLEDLKNNLSSIQLKCKTKLPDGSIHDSLVDVYTVLEALETRSTMYGVIGHINKEKDSKIDSMSEELTQFIQTLLDIQALNSEHKLDLKRNSTNFKMRGNQLVILDPLLNVEDMKLNVAITKSLNKYKRD